MRATIERLRARPEHVRKQVAFGIAGSITGLVFVGWMAALATGGALTLKSDPAASKSFAEANSQLMAGVAASGKNFLGSTTTSPTLTIEDRDSSSTFVEKQPEEERTVISF